MKYCHFSLLICFATSFFFFSIAMATKENVTFQRGMLKSIQSKVNTLASILYVAHVQCCMRGTKWPPLKLSLKDFQTEISIGHSKISAHIFDRKWSFLLGFIEMQPVIVLLRLLYPIFVYFSLIYTLSDRFPAINNLIQRINLRKRRDSLILGAVIGVCTILLLLYAFH